MPSTKARHVNTEAGSEVKARHPFRKRTRASLKKRKKKRNSPDSSATAGRWHRPVLARAAAIRRTRPSAQPASATPPSTPAVRPRALRLRRPSASSSRRRHLRPRRQRRTSVHAVCPCRPSVYAARQRPPIVGDTSIRAACASNFLHRRPGACCPDTPKEKRKRAFWMC
ncbi:uncharacterized protein [Triticum aestivum]|uniref:uncharacterized protein n=1 Tax=Triticum aestivum TaxID=4565 RepID=UPI001D021C54|nr:uncharacterized protein LOC123191231 [Triticum aestivum]